MRLIVLVASFIFAAGAAPMLAQSASPAPEAALRVQAEAWRQDLDMLLEELPKRHKKLFFRVAEGEWRAAGAALRGRIGELADHQVVVEMMRLVAIAGDGHTGVSPPAKLAFRRVPLMLAWFRDGIFVVAADEGHAELLGAQVLKIGAVEVGEAAARVATLFANENDSWMKVGVPARMTMTEALHGLGPSDDPGRARFTVRTREGEEREAELSALESGAKPNVKLLPDPAAVKLPISRQKRERANWFEWMESEGVLYCRYDTCADEKGQSVAEYSLAVLEAVDARAARRVIIDLRNNSGGNSALLQPLVMGLRDRRERLGPGGIVCLIGKRTFSSAQLNAVSLRKAGAVLMGEPTGQKPNAYGEVKTFTLPNSGVVVSYSTKYFKTSATDEPSTMPEVLVEVSSKEFFAGRDPVLEAALAYAPK
jgi:hypothetical protein